MCFKTTINCHRIQDFVCLKAYAFNKSTIVSISVIQCKGLEACAGPEKIRRGGHLFNFSFSHQHISQRAVLTSIEKLLGPMGPIASRGGSVPVFLRKPTVTFDFPGGGGVSFVWIRMSLK